MRLRILVSLIIVLILSLFPVLRASAHGRTPRLEISVDHLNPGGVLDIRGVEFDYEELVTLYLERQGIVVSLGEITADLEGIFIETIVLPSDLPVGEYSIRGVTDHHDVLSPVFTVQGSALSSEGDQREERGALQAPMPTYAPVVVPTTAAQSFPQSAPVPDRRPILLGLLILIALAVGLLTFSRSTALKKR